MSHVLLGVWLESVGVALIKLVVLCHISFIFPVLMNYFFLTVLSYTPKPSFNPGVNPNEACCARGQWG